jgi:hypothetical protein
MMKSADEMARLSAGVQKKIAIREKEKQESDEYDVLQNIQLEKIHQEFKMIALAAARNGEQLVVVPDNDLSLSRLKDQGFVAKHLTRRTEYEAHLAWLCESKKFEFVLDCDRVILDYQGLLCFEGDGMYHRSPLVSALETLWRIKDHNELLNTNMVLKYVSDQSSVQNLDIEKLKQRLETILSKFFELKQAETRYQSVSKDNLLIPNTENKSIFVSWESADVYGGLQEEFSAQQLKWLATRWPIVSKYLNEWIENAANEGDSELELLLFRTAFDWRIHFEIPSHWEEKDDQFEQTSFWDVDQDLFFPPSLAVDGLEAYGYSVSIELLEKIPESLSSLRIDQGELTVYRLKIAWPENSKTGQN